MDPVTQKRQLAVDVIKRIEQLPRPEKWRVTREFLLANNPKLVPVDYAFIKQVARERNQLHKVSGISKTGDSRYVLSMPDFMFAALIALDPWLKPELDDKDRKARDRAWNKLARAFPEYAVGKAT